MNHTDLLIEELKKDEGFRANIYKCPAGYNTIGYGFNVDAGVSKRLGEVILRHQVQEVWEQCNKEFGSWWHLLSNERRGVVINMVFNLGMDGFKKFKRMIACLSVEDYEGASEEMLDSRWADQVGKRATRLSEQMKAV